MEMSQNDGVAIAKVGTLLWFARCTCLASVSVGCCGSGGAKDGTKMVGRSASGSCETSTEVDVVGGNRGGRICCNAKEVVTCFVVVYRGTHTSLW